MVTYRGGPLPVHGDGEASIDGARVSPHTPDVPLPAIPHGTPSNANDGNLIIPQRCSARLQSGHRHQSRTRMRISTSPGLDFPLATDAVLMTRARQEPTPVLSETVLKTAISPDDFTFA